MCWMICIWVLRNSLYCSWTGVLAVHDWLFCFSPTENNAYSFGRTTIANLDTEWVTVNAPLIIYSVLYSEASCWVLVFNADFPFIPSVIHYCGCTPPLHFFTCYWRCTAWDGTPLRCTTRRMTWLVACFQIVAASYWILHFVANCFISTQVKRTLFVNGISKYAEESEIKQHFE